MKNGEFMGMNISAVVVERNMEFPDKTENECIWFCYFTSEYISVGRELSIPKKKKKKPSFMPKVNTALNS